MQNPHDKFFKKSMSNKETAKSFLVHYLPQDLLEKIDLTTLEIEKDSFTDEELNEHFSDTVYKANLAGKEAYLCFLLEHKSYPYSNITLQLLKYMLKIWQLKDEQGAKELPLIVPMLIYHGRNEWNIGLNLSDILQEIPLEAEKYLPDFEYILFDLSTYSKEEIKETGQMRVFIEVLSAVFQDDFEEKLFDAIKVLKRLEKQNKAVDYFQTVVKYILSADVVDIGLNEVAKVISQVSKEKGEEVMSIAEKLKKEGKVEIIKNMLDSGMDVKQISKMSKFSKEEIERIQKGMKH